MIGKVIFWSNGMTMVFDENGQQVPDYQGPKEKVLADILRDAPLSCQFQEGNWQKGWLRDIDRPGEAIGKEERWKRYSRP